jgi:hypothetical protein
MALLAFSDSPALPLERDRQLDLLCGQVGPRLLAHFHVGIRITSGTKPVPTSNCPTGSSYGRIETLAVEGEKKIEPVTNRLPVASPLIRLPHNRSVRKENDLRTRHSRSLFVKAEGILQEISIFYRTL